MRQVEPEVMQVEFEQELEALLAAKGQNFEANASAHEKIIAAVAGFLDQAAAENMDQAAEVAHELTQHENLSVIEGAILWLDSVASSYGG